MGKENQTFMSNLLAINPAHTIIREEDGVQIFDLDDESYLLEYFNELNEAGKEEALRRVQELTEIPRYSRLTMQEIGDRWDVDLSQLFKKNTNADD